MSIKSPNFFLIIVLKNNSFSKYTATFMPYRILKEIFFYKRKIVVILQMDVNF